MHVLVTRPTQDAAPLLERLRERGIEATAEPLLEIVIDTDAEVDLRDVQAVLTTSANGVRALAAVSERRDLRLFAVGDATAKAAAEAGFEPIESAGGDVADLAALVARRLDPEAGAVLHVAASQTAGDLAGDLKERGFVYRRAVLYEARPAAQFSPATVAALRDGRIDGVLLYSPRTADVFVSLLRRARIVRSCRRLTAYCLSPAVAERARAVTWREIAVAATPEQDSLLALIGIPSLGPWSDMTKPPETHPEEPREAGAAPAEESVGEAGPDDSEPSVDAGSADEPQSADTTAEETPPEGQPAEPAPQAQRPSGRRSVVPTVILWTLLLLAAIGGAVYAAYPFWAPYAERFIQAMQPDPFADPRMSSLSERVSALEHRAPETQAAPTDGAMAELEQRRAELSQQVGQLVDRVNSLESSLASVRKLIEATNLPQEAEDARRSLEDLSQRLARLEGETGGVGELKTDVQELDAESNRLSESVASLRTRVDDLAETQKERMQAAATQVRASVIAAGRLREALRSSAPFTEPLAEFRVAAEGDQDLLAIADELTPYADKGIPVLASLRTQFDEVARGVARAERQVAGEGWMSGVVNRLGSLVSVRRTTVDEADESVDALLARAEAALDDGDLAAAVTALEKLGGAPKEAAADWLAAARARVVAEQAMAALHVHAVSAMAPAGQ